MIWLAQRGSGDRGRWVAVMATLVSGNWLVGCAVGESSVGDALTPVREVGASEAADSMDVAADCKPESSQMWCAYGVPGGRCDDVQWQAVCRDGRWLCEAYAGYPGGIPASQCSGFGPAPVDAGSDILDSELDARERADTGEAPDALTALSFGATELVLNQVCIRAAHGFSLHLENRSPRPLGPLATALTQKEPTEFYVTNDSCTGAALQPGASCRIDLYFLPITFGKRTAVFEASAPNGEVASIAVSGEGEPSEGGMVMPHAWEFAAAVGTRSAPMAFAIQNYGLRATGPVAVSLLGDTFLVVSDECTGNPLPPGAGCAVEVVFSPRRPGVHTTTLIFEVQDVCGGVASASLSGRAPDSQVDASPMTD